MVSWFRCTKALNQFVGVTHYTSHVCHSIVQLDQRSGSERQACAVRSEDQRRLTK